MVQIQNAQLAINASRTSKAGKPQKNYVFLHGVLIPGPICSKPDISLSVPGSLPARYIFPVCIYFFRFSTVYATVFSVITIITWLNK